MSPGLKRGLGPTRVKAGCCTAHRPRRLMVHSTGLAPGAWGRRRAAGHAARCCRAACPPLAWACVPLKPNPFCLNPIHLDPRWDAEGVSIPQRGPGKHLLTGPIYICGAEPGDTVKVGV